MLCTAFPAARTLCTGWSAVTRRPRSLRGGAIARVAGRAGDEDHPVDKCSRGKVRARCLLAGLLSDPLHARRQRGPISVDALKLLQQPLAWDGPSALRTREIRIELLSEALGLASTVSLEPEPSLAMTCSPASRAW
ncbi:MAG TPA: AAA family ATPase [Kofleriaceae bacterium]